MHKLNFMNSINRTGHNWQTSPQIQFMLRFLHYVFLLLFSLIFFQACKPKLPGSSEQVSAKIEMDSLQKKRIDSLNFKINQVILSLGPPNKIPYPVVNIKDTIYYWLSDDYTGKISIELEPPDEVEWPMFFIYQKELVKIRYRHLTTNAGVRQTYESNIYFNKGKIVYCEERGRVLAEGEPPGATRQHSFKPTTRSYQEVEGDYIDTWKTILEIIRKIDPKANHIIP